ncbi:MAG: hypothetical protein KDM91_20175 [Verrucomicrobiae bacterium]|nr:hypothetical protein [Verrucomicrobiae bacterium]MCP5540845.1 hypothetical protein [Akkermansiaceae bacterium]
MRLFLDTDVLVDVAIDRQPYSETAARLLDRIQKSHASSLAAYVSWNSFLEFSQAATPLVGNHKTAEFCSELCGFVKIANVRADDLKSALAFQLAEFRATLQAAAAIACAADLIVTSRAQAFNGLRIPIQSPGAALESLGL